MRARTLSTVLVVAVASVGAFFAGRAAVTAHVKLPQIANLSEFEPVSLSFISADRGWALGTAPCSGGQKCLGLVETRNGARTWSIHSLPTSLRTATAVTTSSLNVRFADPEDGWIYGSLDTGSAGAAPALWSTHDGGTTWRHESLTWAARTVFDLEASAGTVQLLAPTPSGVARIESSPVSHDAWRVTSTVRLDEPSGGASFSGSIVLKGLSGWVVEGNDRGTSGAARLTGKGTWANWTPPCVPVGGSYAVAAASSPADLVAVCTMGGFASALSSNAPPGATLGSNWLYFSDDGGTSFSAGPEVHPTVNLATNEVLASPTRQAIFILRASPTGGDLLATFNRGATWATVVRGDVSFLSFASATDAVGLEGSPGAYTTMIVSRDGGHRWSTVSF